MKFYIILVLCIGVLIWGGFVVYPKPLYFEYDGQKYYSVSTGYAYQSKNGHTISLIMDSNGEHETRVLEIENDDVLIELSFLNDGVYVFIEKGALTYTGLLDAEDVTIVQSLIKYLNLAKSFDMYQSTMNEDFSIVIYIPLSVLIVFGIIYFNHALKHAISGSWVYGYTGIAISSAMIIFSLVINAILVMTHL